MLGPLTYQAIVMLTRRRLERLRDLLAAKTTHGANINNLELQIFYLAEKAVDKIDEPPHPVGSFPADSFAPWLVERISKHALLGAVGPEIPRYAAYMADSQSWLADTVHRGQPDPDREPVLSRSTDLALEFWQQVQTLIEAEVGLDDAAKKGAKRRMAAYVLGHMCHIAADVLCHPFVDDVAWHLEDGRHKRFEQRQIVAAIDDVVAEKIFHRERARGKEWGIFWLEPSDVPEHFFQAWKEALEAIYGPGARRTREGTTFADKGFFPPGSKRFEDRMKEDNPPELSAQLLREGYDSYRALFEREYAWNYGDAVSATIFMFLPSFLMLPLAATLPEGRDLFRDGADPGERAWSEALTFPFAANFMVPLGYSIYIMIVSSMGVGAETLIGLIAAVIQLVMMISFFSTLKKDVSPGVRWGLFLATPFVATLIHMIVTLALEKDDENEPRRTQLALSSGLHLFLGALFFGAFALFLHLAVEGLVDDGFKSGAFWGFAVLWLVILVIMWLLFSLLLIHNPKNEFVTGRPHFVRLFDDTTLFHDPVTAAPTLAQRHFPSGRRPLLKLWWEGNGDLFLRSDRDSLVFSFSDNGSNPQLVMAPLAPMKVAEYANFLTHAVQDSNGNFSQELHVVAHDAEEPLDYRLPPGELFSDHGDTEKKRDKHDEEAAKFKKLPTEEEDALVIYHAPRDRQAARFGPRGPAVVDEARHETVAGAGNASVAAGNLNEVVGNATTRFWTFFQKGDVIALGNDVRVVASVQDDQHLTVQVAFASAIAARAYERRPWDRDLDLEGEGTTGPHPAIYRDLQGADTHFDQMFLPGDIIRLRPKKGASAEERTVTVVQSATQLTVDRGFSQAIRDASEYHDTTKAFEEGVSYERVGRITREGFAFVPQAPTSLFDGETVMERAADLATLLCLGATSHLLTDDERTAGNLALPSPDPVEQVFRNWNLDRRRTNEWRMLVSGRAVSEKNADPDPLQPRAPAGRPIPPPFGEGTANQLGWLPLFARWLDMARRPGVDSVSAEAFRAGDPSNLELSQAVAYLMDLPDPDPGP